MKNIKSKAGVVSSSLFLSTLLAPVALADAIKPLKPIKSIGEITNLIDTASSWFLGIIVSLSVIFLLYAAFLYLTNAGDEDKIGKAKGIIIYVVVAIVVALVAAGLVNVIQGLVGGGYTPSP